MFIIVVETTQWCGMFLTISVSFRAFWYVWGETLEFRITLMIRFGFFRKQKCFGAAIIGTIQ